MQIFSAINSNKQLLTGSQCKRYDYVDINYFIGLTFQRKRCRDMVFEPRVFSPSGRGIRHIVLFLTCCETRKRLTEVSLCYCRQT